MHIRYPLKQLVNLQLIAMASFLSSCIGPQMDLSYENPDYKVIFLHHSTGNNVWYGDINPGKKIHFTKSICMVPRLVKEYNEAQGCKISLEERNFPSGNPYPWENYPYDYYNIWVKNAGNEPFTEEPTLEILTKEYNLIMFKHCFPMSNILEDDGNPDINSDKKTLANYKLQYNALKNKLHEFPQNKFIVWTGPALVESFTTADEAKRAREFATWVINEWDEPDDNIFIFDFRQIETEGGLYLKSEYATNTNDPHPNILLSEISASSLVKRLLEVIDIPGK
jgi:hypothetical protein